MKVLPASRSWLVLGFLSQVSAVVKDERPSKLVRRVRGDGERSEMVSINSDGELEGAEITWSGKSEEVSSQLHHLVRGLFGKRHEFMDHRLKFVETSIHADFSSRPEILGNKVPAEALRPLARTYFVKEHGWIMKGLEPAGMTPEGKFQELHEVPILRHGAPALAVWLGHQWKARHHFSLNDASNIIAALEWLTLDHAIKLTDKAYELNDYHKHKPLNLNQLKEVMRSYLLVFRLGYKAQAEHNAKLHQKLKRLASYDASYKELVQFQEETLKFSIHMLPNRDEIPRDEVEKIVLELAAQYGKWQNRECKAMKHDLLGLQGVADGTVPFKPFHDFPTNKQFGYYFGESQEYLRRIGALDENNPGEAPKVLIANYLTGPTNCIATTQYTAVCCINECEAPLGDLERKVREPSAYPSELMRLAQGLRTETVNSQRQLPENLMEKLQEVADEPEHKGRVPLRGAGFAQWLHFVLPNECPKPVLADYRAEEEHASQAEEKDSKEREEQEKKIKEDEDKAPLHHLLGDENCTRVPSYMDVLTADEL